MTDKPSDRATALAFWKACDTINLDKKALVELLHRIELDAREIDAAAPDGAQAVVACHHVRVPGLLPTWVDGPISDDDAAMWRERGFFVGVAYTAPPSQDAEDAARLDWLLGGTARKIYRTICDEWCAQDGVLGSWYGNTPREAINAARAARGGGSG